MRGTRAKKLRKEVVLVSEPTKYYIVGKTLITTGFKRAYRQAKKSYTHGI